LISSPALHFSAGNDEKQVHLKCKAFFFARSFHFIADSGYPAKRHQHHLQLLLKDFDG